MPKDPQSVVTDYTYTQNRELSWAPVQPPGPRGGGGRDRSRPGTAEIYRHFRQQSG